MSKNKKNVVTKAKIKTFGQVADEGEKFLYIMYSRKSDIVKVGLTNILGRRKGENRHKIPGFKDGIILDYVLGPEELIRSLEKELLNDIPPMTKTHTLSKKYGFSGQNEMREGKYLEDIQYKLHGIRNQVLERRFQDTLNKG